ncbi:hypothetical protein ACR0ST_09855 [Aliidiomarina sp. Khilg15.8]
MLASMIVVLSACNQQEVTHAEGSVGIDQGSLCEVDAWQRDITAAECEPGQKVVFLPGSFGNEQLPVIFAAVNCDHRFSIALTKGGVSCIYTPLADSE